MQNTTLKTFELHELIVFLKKYIRGEGPIPVRVQVIGHFARCPISLNVRSLSQAKCSITWNPPP